MSVYFTSDHHFGHSGARSFYRRPFASVAEMDRAMIDLPSRLPPNVAVVLTASDAGQHWVAGSGDGVEIMGTTNDLFAWLTGRAPRVGEQECPPLKPWR